MSYTKYFASAKKLLHLGQAILVKNMLFEILFVEFNSCEFGEETLGVGDGRIKDSQMTSSSFHSSTLSTARGRLYGSTSWSARKNDQNQWIQVDLGRTETVTGVATQGRRNARQWVKTYSLSHSLDGKTFETCKVTGKDKVIFFAKNSNLTYDRLTCPFQLIRIL